MLKAVPCKFRLAYQSRQACSDVSLLAWVPFASFKSTSDAAAKLSLDLLNRLFELAENEDVRIFV